MVSEIERRVDVASAGVLGHPSYAFMIGPVAQTQVLGNAGRVILPPLIADNWIDYLSIAVMPILAFRFSPGLYHGG